MLSKSKGQILRVAATLHVLFHRENPVTLSEEAVKAAENFVEVCVQHAAYLAGRGAIEEAIQAMHPENTEVSVQQNGQAQANASYSLLLPGKVLHLNALLAMKKFQDRGNKDGAVRGFLALQEAGFGSVIQKKPQCGTSIKLDVPSDAEIKSVFIENLMKFGVSLQQYKNAIDMEEVTMSTLDNRKRHAASTMPPTRKSPRKNLITTFTEEV